MASFTIGEEVHYQGKRFVISRVLAGPPQRYRLLATTPDGALVVWAAESGLEKIERYTKPVYDTDR